jgi:hypothetical protein
MLFKDPLSCTIEPDTDFDGGHWYLMAVSEEFWGLFVTSPNTTEAVTADPADSASSARKLPCEAHSQKTAQNV